ncbi:MAG: site-specific integrase [Bacilli bacterium]|jgi:integrase|nr:site-specific integrase [Bacilli bacterium]
MAIVEDRANGKYYISYHIKYPDGETKTVNIKSKEWTIGKGKRFMKQIEASEIESDKAKRLSNYHLGGNATFSSLCDAYVREQMDSLKPQTAYGKALVVKDYMMALFDRNSRLDRALTAESCSAFRDKVASKGYTSSRTNQILQVARSVIDYACDRDLLSYESGKRLQRLLKPVNSRIDRSRRDPQFWTTEEYDRFIATFKEGDADWKWRTFFETMYWGALRASEAIGLKWKYVNFDRSTISIIETVDKSGRVGTTKNSSSDAPVSLPKDIMAELSALKESLYCGDDDYCFFVKHVARTSVKRMLDKHAKMAGVKQIRVHDLRHSMASRLINAGVNPLIVSKHLRHASTQQTLDTYSHLFPSVTDGLMDKIEKGGTKNGLH